MFLVRITLYLGMLGVCKLKTGNVLYNIYNHFVKIWNVLGNRL